MEEEEQSGMSCWWAEACMHVFTDTGLCILCSSWKDTLAAVYLWPSLWYNSNITRDSEIVLFWAEKRCPFQQHLFLFLWSSTLWNPAQNGFITADSREATAKRADRQSPKNTKEYPVTCYDWGEYYRTLCRMLCDCSKWFRRSGRHYAHWLQHQI